MKVKSFGCSFLYGSDLPDCQHGIGRCHPGPSALTWPSLLAERLNLPYECHAWPGIGNLKILERILYHCQDPEPSLFLISWTWIDRFDYIQDQKNPWQDWTWGSIMPGEDTRFAKDYYKSFHTQLKDQLSNLIYIKTTIETLQAKRIGYIMTCQDDLLFENLWIPHAGIAELQDYCQQHMRYFKGMTFLEWSKSMKFEISGKMHPLSEAHQAACDYVMANFISSDFLERSYG